MKKEIIYNEKDQQTHNEFKEQNDRILIELGTLSMQHEFQRAMILTKAAEIDRRFREFLRITMIKNDINPEDPNNQIVSSDDKKLVVEINPSITPLTLVK